MDSNFKLNQLYIFNDLTIAKVVNEHEYYPTFKETRSEKQFACNIINLKTTAKCTELFFKIEEKYQSKTRTNYCAFQFLTDLFQLVFHKNSNLVQSRGSYDAALLSHKSHFDCILNYKDKFVLKVNGKKVEDILISNFDKTIAEQILKKHNRLFECL